ncbi:hypothetical protein B7494_g5751 [Chlorociboria aeruginascens]|nr:hypothetical protein B7494_g5751 [Chlorociboria aeruginascens]
MYRGGQRNATVDLKEGRKAAYQFGATQSLGNTVPVPVPVPVPSPASKADDERVCFEWYMCQAGTKLPGLDSASGFWAILLPQASAAEPAVLHAVLALSSAHRGQFYRDRDTQPGSIPDGQEQFTLRQYSKAIRCLQPHFATSDIASVRVALVACFAFVCMEFLRGHYRTGLAHLQNGLKLLGAIQAHSSMLDSRSRVLKPSREVIDDWIIEAFAKLHVQARLFGQGCQHLYLAPPIANPRPLTRKFLPVKEERLNWDRVLNEIFDLTEQCRREGIPRGTPYPSRLLDRQRYLLAEIMSWVETYHTSLASLPTHTTARQKFAYRVLHQHYTMANVMAQTCLNVGSELMFDLYTRDFIAIITQSIDIWKVGSSNSSFDTHGAGTSKSISDIGWLAPIYFTACKCRVHRVRLQAIRLMNSVSHKEGIFDATLAACIGREVMRIEERDFYKDVNLDDDFPLYSTPEERDSVLPTLPESYRIHEIQVVLPDDSTGQLLLTCRRTPDNGLEKIPPREYDLPSQSWRDATKINF